MDKITEYKDLIGKVANSVVNHNNEELIFNLGDGTVCKFYHSQDCCEVVYIEDIIGELSDLEGSIILQAEEIVHVNENPEGVPAKEYQDSFTWTFYKFATMKGYVTVRWYGESNGYYSESVNFTQVSRPIP